LVIDIHQYSLSTPFLISSASYDSKFYEIAVFTFATGLFLKDDGNKFYVLDATDKAFRQYSMGTTDDISTGSYDSVTLSINAQDGSAFGFCMSADGARLYMAGAANDSVYQYNLGTPWDMSTMSYSSKSFLLTSQGTNPSGAAVSTDGTKILITFNNTGILHQYTMATPFELDTISYDSVSLHTTTEDSSPLGLRFNTDGTKFFILGTTNATIYQYST